MPLSDALDDHRYPLADADTHRRQAVTPAAPMERVNERRHQPRTRWTERVAHRDRAAVAVALRRIHPELLHACQTLRGERLVQLDQVDIVDREAGSMQRLASFRN